MTDYYETFKRECVPIGTRVNPNIAMVSSFSCHPDEQEALRRGTDGFRFFQFALGHFYGFGKHKPGRTNIWERYEAVRDEIGLEALGGGAGGIGTPKQLREHLRKFADAGVDQAVFIQQGGNNLHENICEDLELFAKEVMPEFKEEEEARQRKKNEELAPYIEAAMKRKERMKPSCRTTRSRRSSPTATTSPRSTSRSCPQAQQRAHSSRCARCARSSTRFDETRDARGRALAALGSSPAARIERPRARARGRSYTLAH